MDDFSQSCQGSQINYRIRLIKSMLIAFHKDPFVDLKSKRYDLAIKVCI